MQLYLYTVTESIDDGLQRLSIRDVDFSGNCGAVFMSLFTQYVRYGRCQKLSSLTLSRTRRVFRSLEDCNIGDREVASLCELVNLFASHGLTEFHYLGLDSRRARGIPFRQHGDVDGTQTVFEDDSLVPRAEGRD